MAEPVIPPVPGAGRRGFTPEASALLRRLAGSGLAKDLGRPPAEAPQGRTAIPAGNFAGQDLSTLGGDARGGSVNLVI
ncbi:MAG: hypothetical protein HYZ11_08905 [Candidatus Tectomicrobia bacterium]|uniref:Uncharacterized protein n=1 Tax=Tectimicrobiota bacterium TaxID=2528274 RepID=A0A932MNL5_UNCTE|nr:hypothetical protein [Candidatus Tectomicrobia bacterium]